MPTDQPPQPYTDDELSNVKDRLATLRANALDEGIEVVNVGVVPRLLATIDELQQENERIRTELRHANCEHRTCVSMDCLPPILTCTDCGKDLTPPEHA